MGHHDNIIPKQFVICRWRDSSDGSAGTRIFFFQYILPYLMIFSSGAKPKVEFWKNNEKKWKTFSQVELNQLLEMALPNPVTLVSGITRIHHYWRVSARIFVKFSTLKPSSTLLHSFFPKSKKHAKHFKLSLDLV